MEMKMKMKMRIMIKLITIRFSFAGVSHSRSVAFSHTHSVLHRDLKPLNLLLYRKTLMVKIHDLGLARAEELDRRGTEVNSGPPPRRDDSYFGG
nr:cyclin-dependent kinase [Tanacetum cinerariifolium]